MSGQEGFKEEDEKSLIPKEPLSVLSHQHLAAASISAQGKQSVTRELLSVLHTVASPDS